MTREEQIKNVRAGLRALGYDAGDALDRLLLQSDLCPRHGFDVKACPSCAEDVVRLATAMPPC